MNSDLEKIYDEAKSALNICDGDVYCRIINLMKEDCHDAIMLEYFDRMIRNLQGIIYFDEDKTPKQFSLDYFGFNLFFLDVFDYYLMVDTLTLDKLNKLFLEIKSIENDKSGAVWANKYFLHKNNILSIFEPKERYVRHTGKNYPYRSALFHDYLSEKQDYLIYLEKEINVLNELLGG